MTPTRKEIFSTQFNTFAITLGVEPYKQANEYVAAPYSDLSTMLGRWAGILAFSTTNDGKSYSDLGMDMLDTLKNLQLRAEELGLPFVNTIT